MSLSEAAHVGARRPAGFSREDYAAAAARVRGAVIIKTSWYPEIIEALEKSARSWLIDAGLRPGAIQSREVPGSFELPLAAALAADEEGTDFVVALGCVIRGETPHFDYVCSSAMQGLMQVQLQSRVPVGCGLLTVDDIAQAQRRLEKGAEAAQAAFWIFATSTRV